MRSTVPVAVTQAALMTYAAKTRQGFAHIIGLPAKPVHFMQVQQLLNRKGQNQRKGKNVVPFKPVL